MKLSTKITLGAGAVALALFLASLVIWLMGLAFNGLYWLSTEGTCGKYHFSATQTINTCDVYGGEQMSNDTLTASAWAFALALVLFVSLIDGGFIF
jgi:hypothetical protein